jgi:hypothetical protein
MICKLMSRVTQRHRRPGVVETHLVGRHPQRRIAGMVLVQPL